MTFNIIYVENTERDWELMRKAVQEHNEQSPRKLRIKRAKTPEALSGLLTQDVDLVLADVFFDDAPTEQIDSVDRLEEILDQVSRYPKEPADRAIPVIAYTRRGALKHCLGRKDRLYDIWDKNTAPAEYVAWRFGRLEEELGRGRADKELLRSLRSLRGGARWHENVLQMAARYDSAWTEYDQIRRAGKSIRAIATEVGAGELCRTMWDVVTEWEALGRAADRRIRGHARHVINVFWLGYYLIHHEYLRSVWEEAWRGLVARRAAMENVRAEEATEVLSDIWFFAALFHDVASCVEKANKVGKAQCGLIQKLTGNAGLEWSIPSKLADVAMAQMRGFTERSFDEKSATTIMEHLRTTASEGAPDHGVLSAWVILKDLREGRLDCVAREAARAMILHNLLGRQAGKDLLGIGWRTEPVGCLLLLCDQIQTWDRERKDEALSDADLPRRAEVVHLLIQEAEKPQVEIGIQYIGPPHLSQSPVLLARVTDTLEEILEEGPEKALRQLEGEWPIHLRVPCWLSGRELGSHLEFGLDKGVTNPGRGANFGQR